MIDAIHPAPTEFSADQIAADAILTSILDEARRDAVRDYEDDEYEDDPDQVFLDFECGMLADGTCMLAGSEDCDWECPRGGMR